MKILTDLACVWSPLVIFHLSRNKFSFFIIPFILVFIFYEQINFDFTFSSGMRDISYNWWIYHNSQQWYHCHFFSFKISFYTSEKPLLMVKNNKNTIIIFCMSWAIYCLGLRQHGSTMQYENLLALGSKKT